MKQLRKDQEDKLAQQGIVDIYNPNNKLSKTKQPKSHRSQGKLPALQYSATLENAKQA